MLTLPIEVTSFVIGIIVGFTFGLLATKRMEDAGILPSIH